MKILHIINPVNVNEKSDLFVAQPIVFESMRIAKKYVESKNNDIKVFLSYTFFEEDKDMKKYLDEFLFLGFLEQSVLDIKLFSNKKKKLPLIKDILNKAKEINDNIDYIIYTNVDIVLMPYFYDFIYHKIVYEKVDAMVINRRTISDKYTKIEELPLMYSEIGDFHPGYDCFIFPFEWLNELKLGNVCIGTHGIGKIFLTNLYLLSNHFCLEREKHLTFHIGDDKSWKNKKYNEFQLHNINEINNLIRQHFIEEVKKNNFLYNLNKGILNYKFNNNGIINFFKGFFK